MIGILLGHQWKSFWRSRNAGKSLAIQVFIAFLTLYMISIALFAGISLSTLLQKSFPGKDVINVYCGFLLYYFFFDLMMRFFLQELPTLAVQPYLAQRIRRSQLVNFLNLRSMVAVFNLLPILLLFPFSFVNIEIGRAHV